MLLRKAEEFEVDPDEPFASDALNRRKNIERLTDLVQSTEQPFVLTVEAPWGWGKTAFVKMWKAHLQGEGHLCLLFNVWEADFVEDPLVAFLGEMDTLVKQELKQVEDRSAIEQTWVALRQTSSAVRAFLPAATIKLLTLRTLDQEQIGTILADATQKGIEGYKDSKRDLVKFREQLQELSYSLIEARGKRPPLVFFIDELDRCRPNFAVEVLERIKHLFSVERVVFVLSLDRHQLGTSLRTMYGADMDVGGYLRRFIDFSYTLPAPETKQFAQVLYQRFNLNEVLGGDSAAEFDLPDVFSGLSKDLELSLREQEQCFTELNLVLRTCPFARPYSFLVPYVVGLKASAPDLYSKLLQPYIPLDSIELLLKPLGNVLYSYGEWVRAAIYTSYAREETTRIAGLEQPLPDSLREEYVEKLQREEVQVMKTIVEAVQIAQDFA